MQTSPYVVSAAVVLLSTLQCFGSTFSSGATLTGRASEPLNANMTTLKAHFFPEHNSERVKIRYGPYTAPPVSITNGMQTFGESIAQKPCTDCLITWIQAGLEYPNGSNANANTGMWLHHTVLSNTKGSNIICLAADSGESFFASGNERTPVDICVNGTDQAGYYLGPDDNLATYVELMNMVDSPRDAVLTITYEFIPTVPASFDKVQSLWLDIGGCNTSELPAQADTTFKYSSPVWTSNLTGRVTFIAGHIHDGGTHLAVMKNQDVFCDCAAAYGQNSDYIDSTPMNMSMSGMPGMSGTNMSTSMDMMHISSMSYCENKGSIAPGDELSLTAYYNTTEYSPMTNDDGSLAPIMGISILYVAESTNRTVATNGSTGGNGSSPYVNAGSQQYGVGTPAALWCGGLAAALIAIM